MPITQKAKIAKEKSFLPLGHEIEGRIVIECPKNENEIFLWAIPGKKQLIRGPFKSVEKRNEVLRKWGKLREVNCPCLPTISTVLNDFEIVLVFDSLNFGNWDTIKEDF